MYRPSADDLDDTNVPYGTTTACSAEPMPRADHKAKKHSRPHGGSQCVAQRYRHRASIRELNAWAEVRSQEAAE